MVASHGRSFSLGNDAKIDRCSGIAGVGLLG